jgi:hypothetical protein
MVNLTIKNNIFYNMLKLIYNQRSKEKTLAEAKRRVGEIGYNLMTNNCQHFVSECRNGNSLSPEVKC